MKIASAKVANINRASADSSMIFPKDWSPLHIAAFRNETWRFAELCQHQAVDQRDQFGITAIHVAAEQGNALAVQFLIGLGAKADVRDGDDWTPLHYAAAAGRLAVIRALHDRSANLDLPAAGKTTPLHLASGFDQSDAVNLLLTLLVRAKVKKGYKRRALHSIAR